MTSNLSQNQSPQLAPPGAGIPFHHRLLLRYYIKPFVASKSSIEASKKSFEKLSEKILKELEGLSEAQLQTKILVPPQAGLEDSSRFWSIAMTLEHLGIVGRKLILLINSLSQNLPIYEKADIGKLKPFGEMTVAESIQDFKKFVFDEFPNVHLPDPDPGNLFEHPWFGPMNCRQYYWLLGTHQAIHLKQIRAIKKGLA